MDLSRLMIDTVTIAHRTSVGEGGDPVFGSTSTIKARVEHGTQLITGPDGERTNAEHAFATYSEVKNSDVVWLPGDSTGDANAARRPILVKKAATLDGASTLYEVYL